LTHLAQSRGEPCAAQLFSVAGEPPGEDGGERDHRPDHRRKRNESKRNKLIVRTRVFRSRHSQQLVNSKLKIDPGAEMGAAAAAALPKARASF
jgi:hypothetical protein